MIRSQSSQGPHVPEPQVLSSRPRVGNGLAIIPPRREWLLLVFIFCVAVLVRLYHLDTVPPGLTHDEAGNGKSAISVLEGNRPLYFTIGNGREPLYAYSIAPVVAVLGPTETAIRLTSVLWGLVLILVTWAWVRTAFDPITALLTASSLSVGFWPLMVSRLGLRAVTLPALFTASVWVLWGAIGSRRGGSQPSRTRTLLWLRLALAGLLLGAGFYTYLASRGLWVILLLFWLYLALFHRRLARSMWLDILVVIVVAVVVAVPLFCYLNQNPEAETRIQQLAEPWRAARTGNWEPLRQNIVATLKIFTFGGAGDPHWIYNISGRPLLDPLSGLLFYAGFLLVLWRWRDPAHFFVLVWLVVGLAPVFITGANSSVMRAIAVQPVVFLMQAIALREFTLPLCRPSLRVVTYLLPSVLLLAIAAITLRTYFDRWPNQRDVRVAYHTTLVEIARYLDAQPKGGTVTISSIYPGFFHDPYSFDFTSHRADLDARWFDGRFALVFPDVDEAFAVFPALASLDPSLKPFFAPQAQLLDRGALRADDLNPWFEVYRWRPRAAMQQLSLTYSVDVGHVVTFVGYQLQTPIVAPGGTVELVTFWRVIDVAPISADQELVLFTHVLDPAHQIAGQQDRLDVPAWNWSPGDLVAQLHRFSLEPSSADGLYPLEIGVYARIKDYPRLPVYSPESPSAEADSILLPPIEVRTP